MIDSSLLETRVDGIQRPIHDTIEDFLVAKHIMQSWDKTKSPEDIDKLIFLPLDERWGFDATGIPKTLDNALIFTIPELPDYWSHFFQRIVANFKRAEKFNLPIFYEKYNLLLRDLLLGAKLLGELPLTERYEYTSNLVPLLEQMTREVPPRERSSDNLNGYKHKAISEALDIILSPKQQEPKHTTIKTRSLSPTEPEIRKKVLDNPNFMDFMNLLAYRGELEVSDYLDHENGCMQAFGAGYVLNHRLTEFYSKIRELERLAKLENAPSKKPNGELDLTNVYIKFAISMCASYDYEHADDTLEQFNERLKGHLNSFIYESAGSHKGFYVGNVIDCCRGMIEKFGDSGKQAILKSIRDTPSSELHTDMFELLQRGEQLSLVNGLAWCDNLVPHSSNDYSVRLQFLRAIKTVTPKDLAFAVKHIGPEPIDSLYGRLIQYAYLTQ